MPVFSLEASGTTRIQPGSLRLFIVSKPLKSIIFDVDGTLAETEELHRAAFNAMFENYGLNWHWDQAMYGKLLEVAGGRNRLQFFIEQYQPDLAGDYIDMTAKMHADKTRIYGEMMASGDVSLRPGVERLIVKAIEKNLKLAIATSTSRKNVDALFAVTMGQDVLARFQAICCGDEVERVKPDPQVYQLALERLNLSPDECLAIEDSHIGLTSALSANIPTLITSSAYTKGEDFTGAEQVMEDLETGKFDLSSRL